MGATAPATYPTSDEPAAKACPRRARRTDELFGVVREKDALYDRPIPERHRIIFYVGHLEAFDWNLLRGPLGELESFDPAFDKLFSFGIDPVDGGLPSDQPSWPTRGWKSPAYNRRLRDTLDARLATLFDDSAERSREMARLLHVAAEHRLMHTPRRFPTCCTNCP